MFRGGDRTLFRGGGESRLGLRGERDGTVRGIGERGGGRDTRGGARDMDGGARDRALLRGEDLLFESWTSLYRVLIGDLDLALLEGRGSSLLGTALLGAVLLSTVAVA